MYAAFARYYDALTADVDYAKRADYFCRAIQRHRRREGRLLLDLACGTGSLSLELARRGWEVIGTDQSADMLSQATAKLARLEPDGGTKPPFFLRQAMEALDLYGTVDVAVCALDSLNHITALPRLRRVFERLALFLETGGLFLFDVNTPFKHNRVLGGSAYVREAGPVFCVWQNAPCRDNVVHIQLDFFERTEGGRYLRASEAFAERAYTWQELCDAAQGAGFAVEAVYEADSFDPPREESQRLVYVLRNTTPHRAFAPHEG